MDSRFTERKFFDDLVYGSIFSSVFLSSRIEKSLLLSGRIRTYAARYGSMPNEIWSGRYVNRSQLEFNLGVSVNDFLLKLLYFAQV